MALLDCMVGVLANQGLNFLASGDSPGRMGNRHPNIAPYETFPTADGWFILAVGNDAQFRRFCTFVGLEGLPDDDRFVSNAARIENRESLSQEIAVATKQWKRDELLSGLEQQSVPAGPINTVAEAFADPQVKAREMRLALKRNDDETSIPGVRSPMRFSASPQVDGKPSPQLGKNKPEWK